jgi:hypothetical protein
MATTKSPASLTLPSSWRGPFASEVKFGHTARSCVQLLAIISPPFSPLFAVRNCLPHRTPNSSPASSLICEWRRLALAHSRARYTTTCHARCHPLQPQTPSPSLPALSVSTLRSGSPFWVREPTLNSPKRTKKMNSENIKRVTNQAIEQLIDALNAGKSEAVINYLAAVAKFHQYSFLC